MAKFIHFLPKMKNQEFHFFQKWCILMQLCFKHYALWQKWFHIYLHECVHIIAPVVEIGKHALAYLYVPTMAKYGISVASSLFAYISYKVFELLKHSFIKCNTLKNCNYPFKIFQNQKIKHFSNFMNTLNKKIFFQNSKFFAKHFSKEFSCLPKWNYFWKTFCQNLK